MFFSKDNGFVEAILESVGEVLYSYDLVGPKFSVFSGTYRLPISPRSDAILVGGWLKIPIKTDLLPKGVFMSDLTDPRLLSSLSTALDRNVEVRLAPMSPLSSILFESSQSGDYTTPGEVDLWLFIEIDSEKLRGIRRYCDFDDIPTPPPGMRLPIPLGLTVGDKFLWFDYTSDFIGALVCGATRSGKSVCVRSWLRFLCDTFHHSYFTCHLIDFKFGVEFGDFVDYPHAAIYDDGEMFLSTIRDENKRRWSVIKSSGCKNVFEYNESVSVSSPDGLGLMPYSLIVVDEVAMLVARYGKKFMSDLSSLVAQTAGAGMYWLLSTQRPSVDIVTGSIKANLGCRISFSQPTAIDSEVVFGEGVDNARQLGNPGRGWCMVGDRFFEFQSLFVD